MGAIWGLLVRWQWRSAGKLRVLIVPGCKLGRAGMVKLAKMLRDEQCRLEELDVTQNELGNEIALEFAMSLQTLTKQQRTHFKHFIIGNGPDDTRAVLNNNTLMQLGVRAICVCKVLAFVMRFLSTSRTR